MSFPRTTLSAAGPTRWGRTGTQPPRPVLRRVAAAGAGCALATTAYVALDGARSPAPLTVAVVVLLVCIVPSGRTLSRRVAVNGVVVLGFLPVLWMPGALRSTNHGALAVASVLGLLLAHVVGAQRPGRAARRLLPELAPADLLLLPGALAACAWGWRLLSTRTPTQAVEALLPGYDHAGHFDMFSMMWRHGAYIASLGPSPDGTDWDYGDYPAGFHAVAASLAQLQSGLRPRSGTTVVTFAHVDPVVVIAGTVVVTACLVSMAPRPRVLPLLAPLTLVLTALLWLPGGQALWHAFENFWLAAALTCCSLLLAARALLRGADSLGGLVAVLAATVGTTLNWLPMLVVCWIGPVIVFWVWWRSNADNLLHRLAGVLVCAAALPVALRTILGLYRTTPVSTLVRATGGIEASAAGPLVLVLVLFVVLSIVLRDGTGRLRDPAWRRLRWVGLGILSGVAVTTAFTVAQRSSIGTVDYYAIKLTLGVLLVAACWVAAMLALAMDRLLVASEVGPRRAWAQVAAVVLACVACTQVLGHMSLARAGREARGPIDRDFAGQQLDYHAMARGIVVAASSADRDDALRAAYVALGSARCYVASLPNAWFHSLTGTFTVRTSAQTHVLDTGLHPAAGAVAPVRGPLQEQPSLTVVVDPDHARALREQLAPSLADRVHTWTTSPRAVTD